MTTELVTIKDYGQEEYLDGAQMQYSVLRGTYPSDITIAYCDTLETARALANAISETVIIEGPTN